MRRILKSLLKSASAWAIRKHYLRLIFVAGPHGTNLTGHILRELMQPEMVVRHQLQRPFWDFSLPMAILGIPDKRYTPGGWGFWLLKVLALLLFSRRAPGWVVLQIGQTKKEILDYWLSFAQPEVCVFTSEDQLEPGIIEEIARKTLSAVIISDSTKVKLSKKLTVIKTGPTSRCDVQILSVGENDHGTVFELKHSQKVERYTIFQRGQFLRDPVVKAIATMLALGFKTKTIKAKLLGLDLSVQDHLKV